MKRRSIFATIATLIMIILSINGCSDNSKNSDISKNTEILSVLENPNKQFIKGVALFGHDPSTGIHFTQQLKPKLGDVLAKTTYVDATYSSMTPIWIYGRQYVMGISSKTTDDGYYWFIQRIFPSGDFGPITDEGFFPHYYATLITLTRPLSGRVYILGQKYYDDHAAFTREIFVGGKLAKENSWQDTYYRYIDVATPLPQNNVYPDQSCFFWHESKHDKTWSIKCITDEGVVWGQSDGQYQNGYQNILAYKSGDNAYVFGHRHHWFKGPWYITGLTNNGYLKSWDTADGEWDNYYQTMTMFKDPKTEMNYLFGHDEKKNYFIQHVDYLGHMSDQIEYGSWDNYFEHLFSIDFDPATLKSDTWMQTLIDTVPGFLNRKLSQITLPASHDSGMSEGNIQGCGMGGRTCNTQTHYVDVGGQLDLGARYFDIRPLIDTTEDGTSEDVHTGHVGKISESIVTVTAGCRGESKASIVKSLQDFFENDKHSNELVILKISHCATPPGNKYQDCTATQISNFAKTIATALEFYLIKGDDIDLRAMTLKELLKKGNILLVVDNARDRSNGIYKWGKYADYYVDDDYSNVEAFNVMADGQIKKLLNPDNHADNGFLLSWTLTLSSDDARDCPLTSPSSIIEMSTKAEPRLYEFINTLVKQGKITKTLFPNLLYVDIFSRTTTNAAIYLNKNYDKLLAYEGLWASETSGHPGAYYKMQGDGNFVILDSDKVLWATNTEGHPGAYYAMQDDGNFVIYSADDIALWATNTEGNPGASYQMQDDGNFVIYSADNNVLWASNTSGNPEAHYVMQKDGNFVIYSGGSKALWASGTSGNPGAYYKMQDDGNFVIYSVEDTALWASDTYGNPGAELVMRDDGNLIIIKK